jgi:hypothetical protein
VGGPVLGVGLRTILLVDKTINLLEWQELQIVS